MAKSKKRNIFRELIPASALAATLCLSLPGAYAAGLGKITVLSPLGQPLRAELDITASREELTSMTAKLASAEAFKQAGIEYMPSMAGIRFAIDKRKDGRPFLRVSTDRPVNDPFLDILVELTWSSGRLVREYTMLLDPPEALSVGTRAVVATPEAPRAPVASPSPAAQPTQPAAAVPEVQSGGKQAAIAPAATKPEGPAGEAQVVKTGDTLAKIARATKPDGVSLDQMLVALFRNNQDAFDGGNMNRLRAGRILSLPDAESVAAIAPAEARKIIVAQANDFNAYRNRLAASVAAAPAAKEEAAKQAAEGKITPKVEEKVAAPAPGKDKLEVSRTEAAKDAKAVQGRITALEEDLVARDRALKEASNRVAELEKNLADLKKLAELKNQSGAQLQQQAQAAKPAPEVKPAVPEPVAVPKAVEAEKPAEVPKPPEPVADKPAEEAKPAEPVVADQAAKPVVAPVETPKPVADPLPPAEEPGFIEENSALVYGGGGLVALVLGYFGFSAWRRKRQGGSETMSPSTSRLSEGDLMANSVFGSTGGQAVDTGASIQTDFSQANLTAIDADEGVDPVAEADVYMAYGRDAQAEEILVDALKNDPARHAIHLKLLEIYAGRKSVKQFETVANDLYGQTGGVGADWEKAAAMGLALDPENALYGGGGTAASAEAEPRLSPLAATTVIVPPAEMEKLRDTMTLPGHFAQIASAVDEAAAAAPQPHLDFELDKTLPAGMSLGDASEQPPEEELALDFDLDLDLPAEAAPAKQAASVPQSADLDIDLSLPELVAATPASMPEVAQAAGDTPDGLDFEFDMDAPAPHDDPAKLAASSPAPLDLSSIDLDLDMPQRMATDPGADSAPFASSGDGEDNPDVATKLELAQAYEEMGDKEGARELLQEVLNEGSQRQQELARGKLAGLDV